MQIFARFLLQFTSIFVYLSSKNRSFFLLWDFSSILLFSFPRNIVTPCACLLFSIQFLFLCRHCFLTVYDVAFFLPCFLIVSLRWYHLKYWTQLSSGKFFYHTTHTHTHTYTERETDRHTTVQDVRHTHLTHHTYAHARIHSRPCLISAWAKIHKMCIKSTTYGPEMWEITLKWRTYPSYDSRAWKKSSRV